MTTPGPADDGTTGPVTTRRSRAALKAAALVGVAVVVLGGLALVFVATLGVAAVVIAVELLVEDDEGGFLTLANLRADGGSNEDGAGGEAGQQGA